MLLTPDRTRFRPLGLFKKTRHGVVSLVFDGAANEPRVARWLQQPPNVAEVAFLESIDRLVRQLKALSVPGVVRFDRLVEGEGGTWFLFHLQEGVPLLDYLGAETMVPTSWIGWWIRLLVESLQHLHPNYVIGYLEPGDILIAGDRLVVCDLGLFEHVCPEVAALMGGNPYIDFVAPEKRASAAARPAADIFSAGAVAFWLATGHSPTSAPGVGDRLRSVLEQNRPELPPAVAGLVVDMLAYHPGERPDAAAALDRLNGQVEDLTGQQPPMPPHVEDLLLRAGTTVSMTPETTLARVPPRLEDVATPRPAAPLPGGPPKSRVGVGAAIGLLLLVLAGWGWHTARTLPVLSVQAGTAFRYGASEPVFQFGAGDRITVGTDGARLKCHGSTLWLDPGAAMTCGRRQDNLVSLTVDGGALRVLTGPSDTVVLHVRSADLVLEPGSNVRITSQGVATCKAGTVTVQTTSATRRLQGGQTMKLL